MKKLILLSALVLITSMSLRAQSQEITNVSSAKFEVKVITSVESIVPSGIGRSRLISTDEDRDYKNFTSGRTEEDNGRNKSKRKDIRVKNFEETKLLNFFNLGGIRFQNIAANDAVISSKLTTMLSEGWDLAFVVSGVESKGGEGDEFGIYITRYIFKRKI